MGSFVPNAIIILAFKGNPCSRQALLWNRQASIILDLVLSVCVFAACGGKASAHSDYESSTGFANYARKLGEDPPLKVEPKVIMSPTKSVFSGGAKALRRKLDKLPDMISARYSAKALPEMIGELSRHLKGWANYYRLGHVRRRVHGHLRRRSHGPRYVTGPSLMSRGAALNGGPGRYPWRRGIITTIFWIGERPRGNNPVPNVRSSWDKYWYYSYGGYDNPDPGSRRNFIPINFVPRQNPFYAALPYNDVEGGHTKYEASQVIPWFRQAFVRDGQTVLKDRWIAVHHGNKVCYAQWEDCGPFRTDHWRYVFGNERPRPNLNQGAGLDVSPAVRDYLGLGTKDGCDWKFVEFREVPPGPWAMYGDNNTFVILRRQSNERFAAK